MTPERLFSIANALAALSWLLLLLLPRRRWVIDLVTSRVVPALFAVLYVGLVVTMFGSAEGGFSTLAGVATLFTNAWMLLAGWLHYLAFDLLIGTWEVRDAQARGIPHLFVVPCLILTFLFGPAGWLLYLTVRSALRRNRQPSPV
jgi:hypothetical protein